MVYGTTAGTPRRQTQPSHRCLAWNRSDKNEMMQKYEFRITRKLRLKDCFFMLSVTSSLV